MTLYYIAAVDEDERFKFLGIYTGIAEFERAMEEAPHNPSIEYETGELDANAPVLTY